MLNIRRGSERMRRNVGPLGPNPWTTTSMWFGDTQELNFRPGSGPSFQNRSVGSPLEVEEDNIRGEFACAVTSPDRINVP